MRRAGYLSAILILGSIITRLVSAQTTTSPDGVEIAYEVHGNDDVTLVMVHGWSCDGTYFKDQVAYFGEKYRIVTVDLAGHGNSGLNRTDWTIEAFGRDVMAVVEDLLLEKYVLVGHSLGALVVLEAASHDPEGLIAVIGLDNWRYVPKPKPLEEVEKALAESQAVFKEDYAKHMREGAPGFFREDADSALVAWVADDMAENDPTAGLATWRSFLVFMNDGFIEAMKATKVPIIAINADRRKTNLEALQGLVPSFRAEIMEKSGHFLMMDDPERFNAILDRVLADVLE
jgi:pimeloyl-ACP methyl ester carboxylesterase